MKALPDYAQTLATSLRGIAPLGRTERVGLQSAAGRVLAQPIVADRDLPPFNRAQMDGYALRAEEFTSTKEWPVAGTIAAGTSSQVRVPRGHCVAIATGAPLPDDVNAVVPHESSDRGDRTGGPVRFKIAAVE